MLLKRLLLLLLLLLLLASPHNRLEKHFPPEVETFLNTMSVLALILEAGASSF